MTDAPDPYLLVLGVRGSIPVAGPRFDRYGGNSTCFALVDDGKIHASIDAGSGLVTAQIPLADQVTILLTHYHWDHIQGLSMCAPMWRGDLALRIIGPGDPRGCIGEAISPPWFPASITDMDVEFVVADDRFALGDVGVRSFPLHHPQGGRGYRFDHQDTSIVVATDHEAGTDADQVLVDAARGAGVLVHDTQYRPEELVGKRGWGHSTWQQAVAIAREAEVEQLLFASHDPSRTDAEIEEMVAAASERFPATTAARPGSRFWAK